VTAELNHAGTMLPGAAAPAEITALCRYAQAGRANAVAYRAVIRDHGRSPLPG